MGYIYVCAGFVCASGDSEHDNSRSLLKVHLQIGCIYMIAVAVAVKSSQPKEHCAESSGEIKAAWSGSVHHVGLNFLYKMNSGPIIS